MTPNRPWLVFSDDWGRHPSSCQHLVRQVLDHQPVTWVNTIGMRPLRLDWSTAKRSMEKIRGWLRPHPSARAGAAPANPVVISPKMWPSFRNGFVRSLNRKLMLHALRPVVAAMPLPPVAVTTLPVVADLVGLLPVHRWVYYCVDDFGVWPGYDGPTMRRMENEFLPKCDTIICVSETLERHVQSLGFSSHLLTHGVDLEHWRKPVPAGPPPEFQHLAPPFVVFWGVVDRRMDLDFLRHLSDNLAKGTIVLVGPREDPDPVLLALPRVVAFPPWPYDRLPELAAAASVLIMPYADIPATRAMQPLKLKEYLATGKPAVVRRLPATADWADTVDLAATPAEFATLVNERLDRGIPPAQRDARARLDDEGWVEKASLFEKWVDRQN